MNINQIKGNKLIVDIVKEILDNDSFYNECEKSIKEIYADNKITIEDTPLILKILVSVYNNYSTIKIDKKDIKEVFILLFVEILNKLNNKEEDYQPIIELLSHQIDLLLISIESASCWKKIYNFCCCVKISNINTLRP